MSRNSSLLEDQCYHPEKGDVCFVPWRKEYWPALVKHSYAKKITYAFFPLPSNTKSTTFTLTQPKKSMKLTLESEVPESSSDDFKNALEAAKYYIMHHGLEDGWKCNAIDPLAYLTDGFEFGNGGEVREVLSGDDDCSTVGDDSIGENPDSDNIAASESDKDENEQPFESSGPVIKKRRPHNMPNEDPGQEEEAMAEEPVANLPHYGFFPGNLLKLTQGVPLNMVIFQNIDCFLSEVWDSNEVRHYKVPERCDLNLKLPYARILNDNDADLLFEHCLNFVRMHEPECRTLPAIDLVTSVIFPEVILRSLMMERNISHEEAAKYMISLTSTYGITNSADNTTKTALAFLADVAAEATPITTP